MSKIDQNQLTIKLSGMVDSGTMISIDFQSLQGANPKDLGYFVAIWQGTQIQDLSDAHEIQNITTEDKDGSVTFKNLELANLDYIIGFGVDNKEGTSICATLDVPKGVKPGEDLNPTLSTVSILRQSSDSLVANFLTPLYNTASTNHNWVALFKGNFTANMYKGTNVIVSEKVEESTNEGAVAMDNIPGKLVRFKQYTLVYGMGLDDSGNPNYSNLISATEFGVA